MGSRAILDAFGEEKNLLSPPEINPQIFGQLYGLCGAQYSTNKLLILCIYDDLSLKNTISKLLI
jgi:hypothetical protein